MALSVVNELLYTFDESQLEEPTNSSTQIQSIWFSNNIDHKQFNQIYSIINNSELSNHLNIPYLLNKEIAEYATGQFVECNGDINCTNHISILNGHIQIYSNNNYENIIGYKYCIESEKYYCFDCMNKANKCLYCMDWDCDCCTKLYFKPNKCNLCCDNTGICDCGRECYSMKCN
eukprot:502438_1